MLLWITRGIIIGAFIGCVFLTVVGSQLGGLMGGLASLTSLGNPDLVRREAMRFAVYGAVFGIIAGSVIGGIIGAFGNIRAAIIGATVGAICFAAGGAIFGSITVNNNPVYGTRVIALSLIGAGLGFVAGLIVGWILTPFDKYFVKKLQRTV